MEQSTFDGEGGLVGMARYNDPEYVQLIDALYQQGKISSRVFAFYMADVAETSKLQLGDFDTSYFKDPSQTVEYIPLSDQTMFWDVNVDAFRIGLSDLDAYGYEVGWSFSDPSTACLDTGTSLMLVPDRVYPQLMKALLRGQWYYTDKEGNYYGSCDLTKYESIYLAINGVYYEVPPSSFVDTTSNPPYCPININSNGEDSWLLGDVFLRNFYTIYDGEADRVAMVPHKTSLSVVNKVADLPLPTATFNPTTLVDVFRNIILYTALAGFGAVTAGSIYWLVTVILNDLGIDLFGKNQVLASYF